MNFKLKLLDLIEKSFKLQYHNLQYEEFLHQKFYVHEGSSPGQDYDDAWILALACHSKSVYDIGSNIGQSALLMYLSPSIQDMVLVDPNPRALSYAAENLIHNGLSDRSRFICAFVSDQPDQEITLHTVGTGAAGSMYESHAPTASSLNASMKTKTTTLDLIYQQSNILPDLIKMDIEGAEGLALKGAKELVSQQQTRIIVEMHGNPEISMKDNTDLVLKWCKEVDYKAWYLKEHCELTDSEKTAHRGRCHLLLQPEAMPFPDYLKEINQSDPVSVVQDLLNNKS